MGRQFKTISSRHKEFIEAQKVYFVGTAAENGRINISPKGLDSIRIIDENLVVWMNLTGSGNETAAHLLKDDRMTIMFCAFEGNPLILRLYGSAKIYHEKDVEYQNYISMFKDNPGQRQIIVMKVEMVQTSCGFGVPLMNFKGERSALIEWADDKGRDGIKEYWKEKNQFSIDGFETNIYNFKYDDEKS